MQPVNARSEENSTSR